MFRCNYMDLGNCNISCALCGEPNTGNSQLGRLVTHSNNMACAAHENCVLERLGNSKILIPKRSSFFSSIFGY